MMLIIPLLTDNYCYKLFTMDNLGNKLALDLCFPNLPVHDPVLLIIFLVMSSHSKISAVTLGNWFLAASSFYSYS